MKGLLFILIALFIDGLQACVSMALVFIAANAGTFGGAGAGCYVGNHIAGEIGCWLGGAFLGVFGTFGNIFAAPILVPIGIVLGFTLNFCLSATIGSGLVFLMWINGIFYPRYVLGGGITELLPGFSNIPAWTAMVILSLMRKKAETKLTASSGEAGQILSTSLFGTVAGKIAAVSSFSSSVQARMPERGEQRPSEHSAARHTPDLKNIDGIRQPANDAVLHPYAKAA